MVTALKFAEVIEAADCLSEDEQETLLKVLQKRLAERRRLEVAEDIKEARLEHQRGETLEATPDELMDEILA